MSKTIEVNEELALALMNGGFNVVEKTIFTVEVDSDGNMMKVRKPGTRNMPPRDAQMTAASVLAIVDPRPDDLSTAQKKVYDSLKHHFKGGATRKELQRYLKTQGVTNPGPAISVAVYQKKSIKVVR